jgi:hypothetical protein
MGAPGGIQEGDQGILHGELSRSEGRCGGRREG